AYIWSFSLIVAGGIGNLIDRIVHNYVIDFIDLRIIKIAVFNFADICAVVGTGLLIVFYIMEEIQNYKKKKKATSESSQSEEEMPIKDE
ncbi:MAG: signal peptidase II, partial [Ruminiclostridium sp.]|nr:signal peptidase II [Ruminiclostridium sp.]